MKLLYSNQNVWFQEHEQNGTTLSPILKYTKYSKALPIKSWGGKDGLFNEWDNWPVVFKKHNYKARFPVLLFLSLDESEGGFFKTLKWDGATPWFGAPQWLPVAFRRAPPCGTAEALQGALLSRVCSLEDARISSMCSGLRKLLPPRKLLPSMHALPQFFPRRSPCRETRPPPPSFILSCFISSIVLVIL